ncbi:MAG TPA: hypothetical protein VIJ94_04925 [Caulobacteraceae bacterium]
MQQVVAGKQEFQAPPRSRDHPSKASAPAEARVFAPRSPAALVEARSGVG